MLLRFIYNFYFTEFNSFIGCSECGNSFTIKTCDYLLPGLPTICNVCLEKIDDNEDLRYIK